ncbi:MAG: hypothetical protein M3R03_08925 [Pseudomonadota bacterium]|nr:hypothetical protein [Pseudomonadota bacterium]
MLRLSLREYLPALATIALWAVILIAIGAADTARLFAATLMLRAIQMLTRLATAKSIKARVGAPATIRKQARRFARILQAVVLAANIVLIAGLVLGLRAAGQHEVALFLPLVAAGMPARVLRYSDVRTDSPFFRLALSGGGLAMAALGWAAGLGAVGMGLAFGMREWIAYGVIRYWPKAAHIPQRPTAEPLAFAEVGRDTAVSGRRLLTYRISKIVLTVFGPAGNFAARTGRGLNWHGKMEPYLPHRLSGFVVIISITGAAATLLVLRSGEPVAMIAAAAMLQIAGASANIALLWRYLPDRSDPNLIVQDDDDE